MKAFLDAWRRFSKTRLWTYLFLWLSMAFFGLAALIVVVAINATGWSLAEGFPSPFYVAAVISGLFALLAKRGKKVHAPKASVSALGGLFAVVAGSLGLGSSSIPIDQATGITVIGLAVTMVLLPFGWRSDAALDEQARTIAKLEAEIARLKSELTNKSETIRGLQSQLAGQRAVPQRATRAGLAFASVAILIGVVGDFVGKALSKRGSRK